MRIRKRKIQFPLSDPNSTNSSIDQDHGASFHGSDQLNHSINGQDSSDGGHKNSEEINKVFLIQEQDEDKGDKSNNTRRGSFLLGAKTPSMVFQDSTSSHQADVCEGEKAFPLKKRRGSLEKSSNEETKVVKEEKMKMRMNKKQMQHNGNGVEDEEEEDKEGGSSSSSKKRVRVRGGALMEGSRCSRVNGRGWRCCQQTLVGYSLCEHHLGKGRLRSMASVRSRSRATASSAPKKVGESQPLSKALKSREEEKRKKSIWVDDEDVNEEAKQPFVITKKKQKLGIVKARSISSLLEQSDNALDGQVVDHDEYEDQNT